VAAGAESSLPVERTGVRTRCMGRAPGCAEVGARARHGLTLVHFSAKLERFLGIGGARRGCVAHIQGVLGGA
jgi:hypothetical protein